MRIRMTNAILMLAAAAGLAVTGRFITDWLMYLGFATGILFIMLWALSHRFNLFMESRVKVLKYIKYDFKNDPIDYLSMLAIWLIVLFWVCKDYFEYKEVGFDVLLGVFGLYLVSCIMVLWGYYKEYDRLP